MLVESVRGKYLRTTEVRLKNRLSNLGRRAYNKGKKLSESQKEDISLATRRGMTPEVRLKISLARRGKPLTAEHRKKIGIGVRGKTRGEAHYKWKGGTKTISGIPYNSWEYADWRMRVFKRDSFTCVFCGNTGKRLQADHILPKCLYPKSAFHLSNGRTLCEDCHKRTPTYGVNKQRITQ